MLNVTICGSDIGWTVFSIIYVAVFFWYLRQEKQSQEPRQAGAPAPAQRSDVEQLDPKQNDPT